MFIIRTMIFPATPLGTDRTQAFKFTHYFRKATNYQCKVERLDKKVPIDAKGKEGKGQVPLSDFTCLTNPFPAVPADTSEGIEQSINILFEPSTLGESRALLTISSPDAGEYQCLLVGQSSSPIPKGPYKIGGKAQNVEFKNPFQEAAEFTIRIDNPNFTCGAKSPSKIEVAYLTHLSFINSLNLTGKKGDQYFRDL